MISLNHLGHAIEEILWSVLRYLSLMEGLRDALQRRRIAHRWSEWRPEVPWMSLYCSVGVGLSLCLVFV